MSLDVPITMDYGAMYQNDYTSHGTSETFNERRAKYSERYNYSAVMETRDTSRVKDEAVWSCDQSDVMTCDMDDVYDVSDGLRYRYKLQRGYSALNNGTLTRVKQPITFYDHEFVIITDFANNSSKIRDGNAYSHNRLKKTTMSECINRSKVHITVFCLVFEWNWNSF